nr:MAG TPA: RNA polymerase subunit [Caudoviricetes sp.]
MRKCPECGANLDSGERCDCEHESDREKLDRACGMIKEAISTMRVADRLLRECGIKPCGNLGYDYDYDISDQTYGRHVMFLSGRKAFERITGEKWKEAVSYGFTRASTVYRGVKIMELQ